MNNSSVLFTLVALTAKVDGWQIVIEDRRLAIFEDISMSIVFVCISVGFPRGPGGTPYNGQFWEAPPERGTFFTLQVYEGVGIPRVEVYEGVGKSVI